MDSFQNQGIEFNMKQNVNSISESDIAVEQSKFEANSKLQKIKSQPYPIHALQNSREFERLGFYLFSCLAKLGEERYDAVWLMPGTKDKGRDIILRGSGRTMGVVQCKKYATKINAPQFIKELLSFILQNSDPEIFNSNATIDYYLMTSSGVTEPARAFADQLNHGSLDRPC